jgi:hypothetical protein
LQHEAFYGAQRLETSGDLSSSRFAIWKNTLTLIADQPWFGVGWGNFNMAWTFTPLPDRPVAFFDHTHNLFLQLAVELGVPAMLLITGLFGWMMWRARGAWSAQPEGVAAPPARAALMMLLVLFVHSQLEYPLWYAYFLLPAAWALGVFLGSAPPRPNERTIAIPAIVFRVVGVLGVVGALFAFWDHRRVEVIFGPPPGAAPLAERIAEGQKSKLFGHHADYAAATTDPTGVPLATFRRPLHHLIDVRLMVAYAKALHAAGKLPEAVYVAQRLREFRRPDAQSHFSHCEAKPDWWCTTEPVALTWRDLEPD